MTSRTASGTLAVLAIVISVGVAGYVAWTTDFGPQAPGTATTETVEGTETSGQMLAREDVETIITEFLLANPELMLDVQDALKVKQEEARVASQKKALEEKRDAIFSAENQVEIGDPDAPITIVEFFDYNCGFCQRALDDMNQFTENDPDVRFVLKEFPVLGEASLNAHKVSMAFSKLHPDKAAEFHRKLLGAQGRKDGEVALSLAESLGADPEKIKAESEKSYVLDTIREVYQLADDLGITGTPSYVIGDEVVFGAVGFASLNEKVSAIKECGAATC